MILRLFLCVGHTPLNIQCLLLHIWGVKAVFLPVFMRLSSDNIWGFYLHVFLLRIYNDLSSVNHFFVACLFMFLAGYKICFIQFRVWIFDLFSLSSSYVKFWHNVEDLCYFSVNIIIVSFYQDIRVLLSFIKVHLGKHNIFSLSFQQ